MDRQGHLPSWGHIPRGLGYTEEATSLCLPILSAWVPQL